MVRVVLTKFVRSAHVGIRGRLVDVFRFSSKPISKSNFISFFFDYV